MILKPEGFERHRTISELAKFCGKSTRTMERYYARGELPEPHRTEAGMKLWSPEACAQVLQSVISKLPSEKAKKRRITRP